MMKMKCMACETSIEKVRLWEEQMMKEYGWYVHFVPPTHSEPCNYHTHGLQRSFGHPDFQVYIPLLIDPQIVHDIFADLVKQVKKGKKFKTQTIYNKIIRDFSVVFGLTIDGDRKVLRMVLPDSQGNLHPLDMDKDFSSQWAGIDPREYPSRD